MSCLALNRGMSGSGGSAPGGGSAVLPGAALPRRAARGRGAPRVGTGALVVQAGVWGVCAVISALILHEW